MSVTKACCTLPPVACDYKEIGKYTNVNDFKVYEACTENFKGTLIVIYDIFGFHNATNQFVDNIAAKTDLRVLVPDLFKGNPFKPEDFPPKDKEAFMKRLEDTASADKCVEIVKQVIQHYEIDSDSKPVAIIGFCWGCKIANIVTNSIPNTNFKAFAACHPSFWDSDTGKEISVPLIALPSKDEFDMLPFFANMKKDIKEKSAHVRFNDSHHGFCAARADLKSETNLRDYKNAIQLISDFFLKRLYGISDEHTTA